MADWTMDQRREFLRDTVRLTADFSQVDQHRGVPPPPLEKPFPANARRIDLVPPGRWAVGKVDLETAIARRQSRREYTGDPLAFDELSFLLWATQGVRQRIGPQQVLRTVPSAGNRHAFETYVAALRVTGLAPAFYRYLPLEHQLLFEFQEEHADRKLVRACLDQHFVGTAAAVFLWTCIPYRMEWRYGPVAHKSLALDAGHVCQNLYLACEAIGAGTCAIGAYHPHLVDQLLRIDGREEFTIYLAPVGKIRR